MEKNDKKRNCLKNVIRKISTLTLTQKTLAQSSSSLTTTNFIVFIVRFGSTKHQQQETNQVLQMLRMDIQTDGCFKKQDTNRNVQMFMSQTGGYEKNSSQINYRMRKRRNLIAGTSHDRGFLKYWAKFTTSRRSAVV
uniref:Uncharacterized protein n=1 Tax=Glossina pallidipes TaxID=7398 RepID=A0A1A9ZZA1_GLOPL